MIEAGKQSAQSIHITEKQVTEWEKRHRITASCYKKKLASGDDRFLLTVTNRTAIKTPLLHSGKIIGRRPRNPVCYVCDIDQL